MVKQSGKNEYWSWGTHILNTVKMFQEWIHVNTRLVAKGIKRDEGSRTDSFQ